MIELSGYSVWPSVQPPPMLEGRPAAERTWPKISIVTPNFNYGHLIEATIRSVLVQEYPNLEYIVIDDGSTDHSLEIIERYQSQLSYFEHHDNQGQYPTINKGFARATGDILGWINSDDIYLPWTLSSVATIFAAFPEVEWIVGLPASIQNGVVHDVKRLAPFPRAMIGAGLFHGGSRGLGWIQQESCFWRRSLWERAGGLRTDLRYAADFELWTRFAKFAELYAVSTLWAGFNNRAGENRSLANRERYMEEVERVIGELRKDPKSPEAKIARDVDRYHRLHRTRGGKAIAGRFLSIGDVRGPILKWHFGESRYHIKHKAFFR